LTAFLALCFSAGAGCPVIYVPDEAMLAAGGAALNEVMADGELSCEERQSRNQYNACPLDRPEHDVESDGFMWTRDWFLDLFPNPFHAPLDCFRGRSGELGFSSVQCCYDGEELVDEGETAGSFDFVSPAVSWFLHFLFDMNLPAQCQEG
jgi:hypothetical protein